MPAHVRAKRRLAAFAKAELSRARPRRPSSTSTRASATRRARTRRSGPRSRSRRRARGPTAARPSARTARTASARRRGVERGETRNPLEAVGGASVEMLMTAGSDARATPAKTINAPRWAVEDWGAAFGPAGRPWLEADARAFLDERIGRNLATGSTDTHFSPCRAARASQFARERRGGARARARRRAARARRRRPRPTRRPRSSSRARRRRRSRAPRSSPRRDAELRRRRAARRRRHAPHHRRPRARRDARRLDGRREARAARRAAGRRRDALADDVRVPALLGGGVRSRRGSTRVVVATANSATRRRLRRAQERARGEQFERDVAAMRARARPSSSATRPRSARAARGIDRRASARPRATSATTRRGSRRAMLSACRSRCASSGATRGAARTSAAAAATTTTTSRRTRACSPDSLESDASVASDVVEAALNARRRAAG